MIQDGRYTLVYSNGEYRTISIETVKDGDLAGKTIVNLKQGKHYNGCGFLSSDNTVRFWNKFSRTNTPERMKAISAAIKRVASNPQDAGMAYAMNENRCCRCGRELTVPASIHAGMGPDCAQKYPWAKQDQINVHSALAATRAAGATFADTKTVPVSNERSQVPNVPVAQTSMLLPNLIQTKAEKALGTDAELAKMVEFQKNSDSEKFYDPFGIGEKFNEKAAVAFWTKRFRSSPIKVETN